MAKKGTCGNCGRENMTLQMRNMCGGCNFRVKGMDVGSAEYKAALAQAKKDFNNPDYKRKPRKGTTAKLSPEVIKQAKTHAKALSIKHAGGDKSPIVEISVNVPETAGIIAIAADAAYKLVHIAIEMQISHHEDMIRKLKEAKNILI